MGWIHKSGFLGKSNAKIIYLFQIRMILFLGSWITVSALTSSKTVKMKARYCYLNDFVQEVAPRMLYIYTQGLFLIFPQLLAWRLM